MGLKRSLERKRTRGVWRMKKDGTMEEIEKATPENLREDLRKLPSNYVTKDTSDPDRIHELDAPHIVEALTEDLDKKHENKDFLGQELPQKAPDLKEEVKKVGNTDFTTKVPVNQERIDEVRFRAIWGVITGAFEYYRKGAPFEDYIIEKRYLWFPENNIHTYELRPGNAPADSERPVHLKGMELWVDITHIPRRIANKLAGYGIDMLELSQLACQLTAACKDLEVKP